MLDCLASSYVFLHGRQHACLQPIYVAYFLMASLFLWPYRIEIEVEYYEREKEMLIKVDSVVIIAKDAPLLSVFMSSSVLAEVRDEPTQHSAYCVLGWVGMGLDPTLKL